MNALKAAVAFENQIYCRVGLLSYSVTQTSQPNNSFNNSINPLLFESYMWLVWVILVAFDWYLETWGSSAGGKQSTGVGICDEFVRPYTYAEFQVFRMDESLKKAILVTHH